MDLQTNEHSNFSPRKKKKPKRRFRAWKIVFFSCLILFLCGTGFLYGTNQGLQFRQMIVGTVLTSSHPEYIKYMHFLLSQAEIDEIKQTMNHPKVVQSRIGHFKDKKIVNNPSQLIKTEEIDKSSFTAKILIISDPTTVHLVTTKYPDKGQPLFELIKDNNGAAGINGGGFIDKGGHGSGGQTVGITISNGKVIHAPAGGNQVSQLVCGFLADGEFITGKYSVDQLMKLGVTDAVHFGPQLIVNGKNVVNSSVNAAWGWAPRTAIGQDKQGRIVMIITDGRFYWDKTHRGATMADMAQLFESYHVINAMAMDGGGSTTMIKAGELLMKPATEEAIGMRYLPNAWVVIPH